MKRRHDALSFQKTNPHPSTRWRERLRLLVVTTSGRNGVPLLTVIPYAATYTHPTTAGSFSDMIPDAWRPRA